MQLTFIQVFSFSWLVSTQAVNAEECLPLPLPPLLFWLPKKCHTTSHWVEICHFLSSATFRLNYRSFVCVTSDEGHLETLFNVKYHCPFLSKVHEQNYATVLTGHLQ